MFHSHRITGKFRPLQDWIILRPIKEAKEVRGGIMLPDNLQVYGRCEVMAVGPGVVTAHGVLVPCDLQVGQFVFIQKFVDGEMKFNLNGQDVYAIRERHVNVTIEDEPAAAPTQAEETGPRPRRARAAAVA